MALIEGFAEVPPGSSRRRHQPVRCTYSVIRGDRGRLVQFNTYGTEGRQRLGKTSQSIQLDEISAAEMVKIIVSVFPEVRDSLLGPTSGAGA